MGVPVLKRKKEYKDHLNEKMADWQILNTGFDQDQFNVSDLSSGMYFINVKGLESETSKKQFVIVK